MTPRRTAPNASAAAPTTRTKDPMNASTMNASKSAKLSAVAKLSPLAALESELNASFPERREVIRALLTAAVAGENAFMLGAPGTAKSNLARVLAGAFQASYFEYLMTRFTEPSELFGPVDPSAFRAGKYARVTANKFPEAEVVFLDEVWKANSAIANSLLTALNERTFDSGSGPVRIPLLTCIGASNELRESAELDAIYDRFLVRLVTDYIVEDSNFLGLLTSVANGTRTSVLAKVDIRAEQAAAKTVTVTSDTLDAIVALRAACKAAGMVVSDRRWVQCLSLVRAAAHLDGRTATETEDLEVLESVLWRKPDERVAVARTIQSTVSPDGARAVEELDAARELVRRLPVFGNVDRKTFLCAVSEAGDALDKISDRLAGLKSGRKVDAAKIEVAAMQQDVGRSAYKASGFKA